MGQRNPCWFGGARGWIVWMTRIFIGVIVVAIVGNAAEHSTAVMMAMKNRMELSMGIAIGSSLQIALFVAPVLVILSHFIGPAPMDLVFTPAEVLAVFAAVLITGQIALGRKEQLARRRPTARRLRDSRYDVLLPAGSDRKRALMEWHNIVHPHSPELDQLAERYGLHPLHIEDCRHHRQSAKIEEDGYIFTVLKSVTLGGEDGFDAGDLDIFLGRDFIITVLEEEHPELRDMIDQSRRGLAPDSRPDQVYYRIIDRVSDSYLPILDHFAETIDSLEDQALESPTPETLATVFRTKRALIMLRRVL